MKILFALLLIVFSSCLKRGDKLLHEGGVVIGKQYTPDTRETVMGTGISTKGSLVITSHSVGQDEQYSIVFKCDHGKIFTINNPDLYSRLKEGDTTDISYYELVNRKGTVKDYEFIDAVKQ